VKVSPRNLYALLCYALDVLDRQDSVQVGVAQASAPADLMVQVLVREVDRLLKRGLAREYVEKVERLRRPRGRIGVSETVSQGLLAQRRQHCTFEELTPATQVNGLLKGSLERALRLEGLQEASRRGLRRTLRRLPPLPAVHPTEQAFRAVRLGRHTASYRLALGVARLLASCCLPQRGGEGLVFDDFTQDEHRMGHLFQTFVRRFLAREQRDWAVSAPTLAFLAQGSAADRAWLPRLETDITLTGRRPELGAWILELKCVKHTVQGRHGKQRLRSEHLYQLLSYLETRARTVGRARGGVLLYAESTTGPMRHDLVVNGHRLLVRTVPLQASWGEVRGGLLGLGGELAGVTSGAESFASLC